MAKLPCLLDRKSTRLNSSHVSISYAVFCLKKKAMQSPLLSSFAAVVIAVSPVCFSQEFVRSLGGAFTEPTRAFILGAQVTAIFFFNDTATPKISTLSLHDALPI